MSNSGRLFLSVLFVALSFLATSGHALAKEVFPGYFKITNLQGGKVMGVLPTEEGTFEIAQLLDVNTNDQQWEVIWVDEGLYRITNRQYGLSLDLKDDDFGNGSNVTTNHYSGETSQQWRIQKRGESVYSICSGVTNKALDVPIDHITREVKVQNWDYAGGGNQIWKIEPVQTGYSGWYFIFSENLKLAIDADAGGAICWLSEKDSDRNVVNIKDKGRYIQQSYYAGAALDRRAEGQFHLWSPFPWNPIQAGDYYGNKPVVMDLSVMDGSIYVKTRPLFWDMNGDYAQVYFETWITLNGWEVEYHARMTRFEQNDIWGQQEIFQEIPACYLSADLRNFYSNTEAPTWETHINQIPNQKIWEHWVTHESWIACVDDSLWGFGVYAPGVSTFAGGLYQHGVGDDPTAYVSPNVDRTFGTHDVFEYRTYFYLGRLNEIQHRIYTRHYYDEALRLSMEQQEEGSESDEPVDAVTSPGP